MNMEVETIAAGEMVNRRTPVVPELYAKGVAGLPAALDAFGFKKLRPGQDRGVHTILAGVDTICVFPTASGKTATFVIPAVAHDWRMLVFSPIKALMRDQVQQLQDIGLPAMEISSDKRPAENMATMQAWVNGDCKHLYVAPERLRDSTFLRVLKQAPPDMVVVDECFEGSVEILTKRGFVRFDALRDGDAVVQVDPHTGDAGYVVPTKVVRRQHEGVVYDIHNRSGVDITVTPGHDLLMYRKDGSWVKKTAGEARFNSLWRFRGAVHKKSGISALTPEHRLQVAYQAYGNAHAPSVAAFSFKRQRKIDRFLQLMEDGGFRVTEGARQGRGRRRFFVHDVPWLRKKMRDAIDLSSFSSEGCRELVLEAIHWGGHEVSDNMGYYCSVVEDNADFYQEACVLAGMRARKTVQVDERKETCKSVHRLFIRYRQEFVDTQNFQKEERGFSGMVYCVEVPSGCIVVRRGGKVVVTGNCHTLSSWTDNFRHSYVYIGDIVERYKPKVVAAFTATFSKTVEADVRRVLRMPDAMKITHYPKRPNLKLSSSTIEEDHDLRDMVASVDGSAIVYCGTQALTESMAAWLAEELEEEVGYYHAGVAPSTKTMYQDAFLDGSVRVICATNAFGMGINKPDIRAVIHYRFPGDPEALVQETGRAGRDGLDSLCHTFYSRDAEKMHNDFIRFGHPEQALFEKLFAYYNRTADSSGRFHRSYAEIEEGSGVFGRYLGALNETLIGAKVIEDCADFGVVHKVWNWEDAEPDSEMHRLFLGLMEEIGSPHEGATGFDLDFLCGKMDKTPATVRKYLNQWKRQGLLDYEAPPKGKPKQIVGDLSLIDFTRLAKKRAAAYEKLKYVLGYFEVSTRDKHGYLENYLMEHVAD